MAGDSSKGVAAAARAGGEATAAVVGASAGGAGSVAASSGVEAEAGDDWAFAGPMEGRAGKGELKWVARHSRVPTRYSFSLSHTRAHACALEKDVRER